jgi:hypothetical protein
VGGIIEGNVSCLDALFMGIRKRLNLPGSLTTPPSIFHSTVCG